MFERQFFILGASGAYGVGSTQGGWAELLKQFVHTELYGEKALGEAAEVYNFAKPGAGIQFVLDTFENQLTEYGRDCPLTAFISVGVNDTKAVNTPDNYVSNEGKFEKDYRALLNKLSEHFEMINVLGFYELDESKVYPKVSPFGDSKSYFKNERIRTFNKILEKVCACYEKANFIGIKLDNSCLFKDGLHPNDKGHQLIFERLKGHIWKIQSSI